MKIGLLNLLGNCPSSMSRHNTGWTKVIEETVKGGFGTNTEIVLIKDPEAISTCDAICINNGVNWKPGHLQRPGGIQPATIDKFNQLINFKGKIFSYNDFVDLKVLANCRKELRHLGDEEYPEVELLYTHKNGNKLIIGDSHSVSIYRPGFALSRHDSATLYGALGEKGTLRSFDFNGYSDITMYFGNIDVRFHLLRQPSVWDSADSLISEYTDFANELIKQGKEVTIQGLLPIEAEDRKLPGTGLYKGKPFYGSQEERQELVDYFNMEIKHNSEYFGFNYGWPWLDAPLGFDKMEARQSVHVRPDYYKYRDELW